jgi:hypothetical protein
VGCVHVVLVSALMVVLAFGVALALRGAFGARLTHYREV